MLNILAAGTCNIDIDAIVPAFTVSIINLVKIVIPIILIVFGMIDLGKAVMSNDEKTMKAAQTTFIKRIVYAVIIFFIVAIVQLVFGMLASAGATDKDNEGNTAACISCFISDTANCKNKN